jgi:hypothetical protein
MDVAAIESSEIEGKTNQPTIKSTVEKPHL